MARRDIRAPELFSRGLPAVGQELVELTRRRGGQATDDVGQVSPRLQVMAKGAADEAEHRRRGAAAGFTSNEKSVLSSKGDATKASLAAIVVDRELTVA